MIGVVFVSISMSSGPFPPAAAAGSKLPQAAPLTKHKVVFLGDQGTGKTTMIKAFLYGTFEQTYKVTRTQLHSQRLLAVQCSHGVQATVGIDFFSKTMYLDDRTVRLQIWDSAGQE